MHNDPFLISDILLQHQISTHQDQVVIALLAPVIDIYGRFQNYLDTVNERGRNLFEGLRHTAPRFIGMQSHVLTTFNVYLLLELTIML